MKAKGIGRFFNKCKGYRHMLNSQTCVQTYASVNQMPIEQYGMDSTLQAPVSGAYQTVVYTRLQFADPLNRHQATTTDLQLLSQILPHMLMEGLFWRKLAYLLLEMLLNYHTLPFSNMYIQGYMKVTIRTNHGFKF